MMKNIRFYTIAVLFDRQLTPKVNRCLHMDIRYSTFDIGSHGDMLSSRIHFIITFNLLFSVITFKLYI